MIHAYLFVTRNFKDNSSHGPEFTKIMEDINKKEGTNITVYHNFHEEVDHYRTHWWQCEKCKKVIKRSMNRAPSKNDLWWNEHITSCGGNFIKIKEPEKKKEKKIEKAKNTIEKYLLKTKDTPKVEVKVPEFKGKLKSYEIEEITYPSKEEFYLNARGYINSETTGKLFPIKNKNPPENKVQQNNDFFLEFKKRKVEEIVNIDQEQVIEIQEDNDDVLEIVKDDSQINEKEIQSNVNVEKEKMNCPVCGNEFKGISKDEFKNHVKNCSDLDIIEEID